MDSKPVVKHSALDKFKHDITPGRITYIIKGFTNLVNLIEPMKSFEWYSPLSLHSIQIQLAFSVLHPVKQFEILYLYACVLLLVESVILGWDSTLLPFELVFAEGLSLRAHPIRPISGLINSLPLRSSA